MANMEPTWKSPSYEVIRSFHFQPFNFLLNIVFLGHPFPTLINIATVNHKKDEKSGLSSAHLAKNLLDLEGCKGSAVYRNISNSIKAVPRWI